MTTKHAVMSLIPFVVEKFEVATQGIPEGVRLIDAPDVWQEERGKGVVVAVLDTGVDVNHPDLRNNIIGGRNFTTDYRGNPNNYDDNQGHGTHVAGSICANGSIMGVAPDASILAVKVLTSKGTGDYSWIIKGIHYAIDWRGPNKERVRVINLSLGGPHDVPELHQAIKRAVENDILVVCAAGNAGDDNETTFEYDFPASYREVIETGAISTTGDRIAPFSNNNHFMDLVAPGMDILSTYPGGRYARLSGTSMASPHVAGACALLVNLYDRYFERDMSECEIYSQLIKRCVPLGYPAHIEGNGLVKMQTMDKVKRLIQFVKENFK